MRDNEVLCEVEGVQQNSDSIANHMNSVCQTFISRFLVIVYHYVPPKVVDSHDSLFTQTMIYT